MTIEMTTKLVTEADLNTPNLGQSERAALLLALNSVIVGTGRVYVSFTYQKQTKTKARKPGEDYVAMPGVSPDAFTGRLSLVARRVDNRANRRAGVVGKVFFHVPSTTRANGINPYGPTNFRPDGVLSFVVTGFVPIETQPAQTPAQE
jgi:hypothetical protein